MVSQILQKNKQKRFDLMYHSSNKSIFFIFSFVFLEKLGKKLLSRLSDLQYISKNWDSFTQKWKSTQIVSRILRLFGGQLLFGERAQKRYKQVFFTKIYLVVLFLSTMSTKKLLHIPLTFGLQSQNVKFEKLRFKCKVWIF